MLIQPGCCTQAGGSCANDQDTHLHSNTSEKHWKRACLNESLSTDVTKLAQRPRCVFSALDHDASRHFTLAHAQQASRRCPRCLKDISFGGTGVSACLTCTGIELCSSAPFGRSSRCAFTTPRRRSLSLPQWSALQSRAVASRLACVFCMSVVLRAQWCANFHDLAQ
jgi:hypothetical protein